MATKEVPPLGRKTRSLPREPGTDESINELLVLLRSQEESPDKALLNETKCLLSLSLEKSTTQPLPSIQSKKIGINKEETTEISDDEVSDASHPPTFLAVSSANAKRHLPSLGCREELTPAEGEKTCSQSLGRR